jgi:hypothetical protein
MLIFFGFVINPEDELVGVCLWHGNFLELRSLECPFKVVVIDYKVGKW